jgi:hypothetical protein
MTATEPPLNFNRRRDIPDDTDQAVGCGLCRYVRTLAANRE